MAYRRSSQPSPRSIPAMIVPKPPSLPSSPSPKPTFKQRFWRKSSANSFSSDSESPPPSPRTKRAYVPRHAASDFVKSTTVSRSPRQLSSASSYNKDDAETLCSYNEKRRSTRYNDGDAEKTDFAVFLAQATRNEATRRASAWQALEDAAMRSRQNSRQSNHPMETKSPRVGNHLGRRISEYIRPSSALSK